MLYGAALDVHILAITNLYQIIISSSGHHPTSKNDCGFNTYRSELNKNFRQFQIMNHSLILIAVFLQNHRLAYANAAEMVKTIQFHQIPYLSDTTDTTLQPTEVAKSLSPRIPWASTVRAPRASWR